MLILFYADWCGACKGFRPVWDQFKNKYMPILDIREVNDKRDADIMKQFGINSFPTVLFLDGEKKLEYNGDRSIEDLERFIRANNNPHIKDNLSAYRKS